MKLILTSINPVLTEAFEERFAGLPNVDIVEQRFERIPDYDCMVSAANSFGLMDGGVDAAITNYFGVELMQRVQQRIVSEYLGEQSVGTSMIVETGSAKHPFLAHTPTMRVPMTIAKTDNVYLAMWAMLVAVHQHNQKPDVQKIETVVCPGLGTGVGRVPAHEAARQMALAYQRFVKPLTSISWITATERQSTLVYGGDVGCRMGGNVKL